ncbi:hypothetical protein [Novosphingobium rosa]|uniref:hypothetical protein n=1 Tax=Novosphingobium rosa TaxID=76978 RepID=UPI00082969CF|nr:hypothetical protein [Novosphingobium rosa]
MKFTPLFLLALGAALSPGMAQAKTGRCVLEVKHKSYLNGPCEVTINDKQGSFSIGVSDKHRSKYFAYVNMDDDGAHGYWNEEPGSTHAHSELGLLKREGACWANATAKVCAYKL